ncbi:hypothetical protein SAMN02745245_00525 [Anaerosphaera aminiphila DSM 21120]|uniref:Cytosolic protein n=1 Tax=Anaerosphaera aminiphila DSM 21120 TaxID=1120995 RepID=A0A1M5Q6V4_9FIRM|nr:DUF6282 family protein [Anaerosphaera aminiphila]SHH09712.1 hypothetical protein SAMN02745245_00525 [Anaerosphaera aminiphila DSM 21120]
MKKVDLTNVFDMHVHTSPDIRERRYTDFDMLEAGLKIHARGIVLKSHHGTTMNRAFLCNLYNKKVHGKNQFEMFGSVVLNNAIGGLNPVAVETGLKMGAKVIWLPTMDARNHREKYGQLGGIECLDEKGTIVEPLKKIFKLIKDYDVALGTGHISPKEIFEVVKQAKDMGLKKIVITHPEFWVVGMTHEEQQQIVKDYDVILERCYAQPLGGGKYKSNLKDNLEIVNLVGYENVMVDTDGGQVENPPWEDALGEYMQYLLDNGISEEKIYHMTRTIPSKLLDVDIGG